MRSSVLVTLSSLGLLAGCATTGPAGMKSGEFVSFACQTGKGFSARAAADGKTVRVRYEGGWELDAKGGGIYEADGWRLVTEGPGSVQLLHNGKVIGSNCKAG